MRRRKNGGYPYRNSHRRWSTRMPSPHGLWPCKRISKSRYSWQTGTRKWFMQTSKAAQTNQQQNLSLISNLYTARVHYSGMYCKLEDHRQWFIIMSKIINDESRLMMAEMEHRPCCRSPWCRHWWRWLTHDRYLLGGGLHSSSVCMWHDQRTSAYQFCGTFQTCRIHFCMWYVFQPLADRTSLHKRSHAALLFLSIDNSFSHLNRYWSSSRCHQWEIHSSFVNISSPLNVSKRARGRRYFLPPPPPPPPSLSSWIPRLCTLASSHSHSWWSSSCSLSSSPRLGNKNLSAWAHHAWYRLAGQYLFYQTFSSAPSSPLSICGYWTGLLFALSHAGSGRF